MTATGKAFEELLKISVTMNFNTVYWSCGPALLFVVGSLLPASGALVTNPPTSDDYLQTEQVVANGVI
jgi:hypothetical protein